MTLAPAYGRDYKSAAAVRNDWNAGKDFQITSPFDGRVGSYANTEDVSGTVMVRYDKQRKVCKVQ